MYKRMTLSLTFVSLLFSACTQADDTQAPASKLEIKSETKSETKLEPKTAATMESFLQIKGLVKDIMCPSEKCEPIQAELVKIAEADQSDRLTPTPDITKNDAGRRIIVAGMAAQGGLKSKEDYWTASLVFQHGSLPEHYAQALIYANKAADLGHENGLLREAIIDRYLMSLGKKQIFATQITAPVSYKMNESEADHIPCLWPVETEIDLLNEYDYQTSAFRQKRQAEIQAMISNMPECNFPALSAKNDLAVLLDLKI